jgi:hypothetical protein
VPADKGRTYPAEVLTLVEVLALRLKDVDNRADGFVVVGQGFGVCDNDRWRSSPIAGWEALMATNDTRDRNIKEVVAKSLRAERLEMRTKRLAAESMANESEARVLGR